MTASSQHSPVEANFSPAEQAKATQTVALRPPHKVMTLARMGAFHQSRLSFIRILLRRLKREHWHFERPKFAIDARGVGTAIYCAHGPERVYSLVAFANDLAPEKRSDRVIATEWDATFVLFDGIPDASDLARLSREVPLQEAGRITASELSISRANRSVRLWRYVVECLARGQQPCATRVAEVGYLMRTTAVYGSGKFGAADREAICDRAEFRAPFQVEMLTVFLIRTFAMDLVEHSARVQGGTQAVALTPVLRRSFGIGNSTGLGMAPFLINHPLLLHKWIAAREHALAAIRSITGTCAHSLAMFRSLVRRAQLNAEQWHSQHPLQITKLNELKSSMRRLLGYLDTLHPNMPQPWDHLWRWAEQSLGLEGQEQLVSLLLELQPRLVDNLCEQLSTDEQQTERLDGHMRVATLRRLIEQIYDWALAIDWALPETHARVWYTSEEKLEPRLGERYLENIEPYEQALSPGRDVACLYQDLLHCDPASSIGHVLHRHPEHRHIIRRVQIVARFPYAEIRSNTIASEMLPIDLLRAKLSFFGAAHFDPRSDRWVRINMFQNAPFPHELADADPDDWIYPVCANS